VARKEGKGTEERMRGQRHTRPEAKETPIEGDGQKIGAEGREGEEEGRAAGQDAEAIERRGA